MEFKLTIGATPELLAALNLLAGAVSKPEIESETKPTAKPTAKPKEKTSPKPESKAEPKQESKSNGLEDVVTLESIRARAVPLTQAGKKDHIKTALGYYGAAKLTDLQAENFDAFWTNLNQIEAGTPLENPNEI